MKKLNMEHKTHEFTFYNIYIKTGVLVPNNKPSYEFTFYNIYIKTKILSLQVLFLFLYLHSTIFILKHKSGLPM